MKVLVEDPAGVRAHRNDYPAQLFAALLRLVRSFEKEIYLVGGTIRDWLLDKHPHDLDFTVDCDAVRFCRALIRELDGGTFVPLGAAEEDAGRVVWKGLTVDFSRFREGAVTIEEDLALRDFTVNSMGIAFSSFMEEGSELLLIDPLQGLADLKQGILRACPGAFSADPLRMLRGYRMWARFGFTLEPQTLALITKERAGLARVSTERISYEMDQIMESDRSHEVIAAMAQSTILFQVVSELADGVGLSQPDSHHLDVFGHSLSALEHMEQILKNPGHYYPECLELLEKYLRQPRIGVILKWGALLHDLGKPATRQIQEEKGGRITFYNHDEIGRALIQQLGRKLRWSNENRDRIAALAGMHMHPFHLCNVRRKQGLSKKACLKLAKRAGDDLIGLFLLSMADSLAGKGSEKPQEMEEELSALLCEVLETYTKTIQPTLDSPRLVTGKDLVEQFGLAPGPLFKELLNALQVAQVEGEVSDRKGALLWLEKRLAQQEE